VIKSEISVEIEDTTLSQRQISSKDKDTPFRGAEVRLDSRKNGKRIDVEATFRGDLIKTSIAPGPPREPITDLTALERRRYLASSDQVDFKNPAFRRMLTSNNLNRLPEEGVLQFGHRIHSFIQENYTHEPHAPQAPSRKPSETLTVRHSDCGGVGLLFVAIMRANGIPSRTLWGRWARIQTDPDYGQWHVIPEFYVDGVGWIRALDKSFGKHSGNFITFHTDTNLELTRDVRRGWAQELVWHWNGSGSSQPASGKTHWWTVEIETP
jgi:transglutaminase-like putative cysteine protease